MKRTTRFIAAAIAVIAALMAFAANVFAGTPCAGAYYEPEVPEKLKTL
jgi:cyclic lactone autoinducer peptide